MIDNSELNELMEILEQMEDEALAASLLAELNQKSKYLGELLLNVNPELKNEQWKENCDKAKSEVDQIISKIRNS